MGNTKMKLAVLTLFTVIFVNASVTIAGTTDTDVHPRPTAPPAFGPDHKTVDPTFGSTIYRVTGPVGSNALHESVETQNLAPIQHFHNPWSMSGDHFLVWANRLSEGGPQRIDVYEIDRSTFTVNRIGPATTNTSTMNFNRGVHFSHTSEWIVYVVDTSATPHKINRCNISSTTTYEGLAANTCATLVTDADGIEQMTQSDDDNIFSWYTANKKVKVWKRDINSIIFNLDASDWYSFDESQISPDGKWVFVKGKQLQGDSKTMVYDATNVNNTKLYSFFSPDYFAGKHSGYSNKWVNETTQFSNYRLVVRDLSIDSVGKTPWTGTPRFAFQHPTNSTGISMHPSYSNSNYVYGGFFRAAGLPTTWFPYMDEIVKIKDDGTEVTRLAHAWSNFYSNSYDEIPAYASPSGDYVLFYSNWNGSSSSSRHDVFIVNTGNKPAPKPPTGVVGSPVR